MHDRIRTEVRRHLLDDLFFGDPSAALDDAEDLFELGLDSLAITRLLVHLERALSCRIPDEDVTADHFRTVDAIVALAAARA